MKHPISPAEIIIVIFLIICLCFISCGCTTIKYGELRYMRVGGQQFENFSATKLDDGSILVEFDRYTGEDVTPTVDAIIASAVKAAIRAGTAGAL